MAFTQKPGRASIAFTLSWQSAVAAHRERVFVRKINFWRDIFPGDMLDEVAALKPGENCSRQFDSGVLTAPFSASNIATCPLSRFGKLQDGSVVTPVAGRFYPQGLAWSALGCFSGNMTPFRVVSVSDKGLLCDTNHPLANYPLRLDAECVEILAMPEERGGSCTDVAELVTQDGPGMQIPGCEGDTDFFGDYPFRRRNEQDDSAFYREPRMVEHLDSTAIGHLRELYGRLLDDGAKVLDLMSSCSSHLPEPPARFEVTGLGLNAEELESNPRLTRRVVHDLNRDPALPFADGEFDAVICTVSIEYLTRPIEVLREAARVVQPGGKVVTVFSNRWFPGKEILPWPELHPFERLGLVLDCYRKAGGYGDLCTETVRGYLRPDDDPHIRESIYSDPVFAVWGTAV
jgi:SAM-dependent methyltransferase